MNLSTYQFRQRRRYPFYVYALEVFTSGGEKVDVGHLSDLAVGWMTTRPGGAFGALIEKNPQEVTGDADTVRKVGRWLAETQPHQFA